MDDDRVSIYEGKDNTTLNINPTIGLSFNIDIGERVFSNNSIFITNMNMNNVIRGFKEILKQMYTNNKLYTVDSRGKITLYGDEAKKATVLIKLFDGKGFISLTPSIVEDVNGQTYEGVNMSINSISNTIGLPIDYLESLYYLLNKIDLNVYGQLMVNYMESRYSNIDNDPIYKLTPVNRETSTRKPSVNFTEPIAEVTANIIKKEPDILTRSFGTP